MLKRWFWEALIVGEAQDAQKSYQKCNTKKIQET